MSRVKVFFMESEGNYFALPKVQDEIALTVRQSVDHLRNRSNCQIVNDFKFSELQNSFEIAGSTLFSLKDIPNPLKAVSSFHFDLHESISRFRTIKIWRWK
jgi:hypothetical protein